MPEILGKAKVEIELFDKLIAWLPDGYCRDILTDLRPQFVRAIVDDQCFLSTDIERLNGDHAMAKLRIDLERKLLNDIEAEQLKLSRRVEQLTNQIRELNTVRLRAVAMFENALMAVRAGDLHEQ